MRKYLITARATILESYELRAASEEDAIERWHNDEGEYLGRDDAYLEPPEIEDVKPKAGRHDTASPAALEADVLREMREALERLAYDASGDQNNPLIRDKTLESIERARVATTRAKARSSPDAVAALLPIVTVTVRGGLVEELDATIPIDVIVEDWDMPDADTPDEPARSVHTLAGGLSGADAKKLRRLIAND